MSGLSAKIHQGRYDTLDQLLKLRKNAIDRENNEVLDAVNQRLKKVEPKVYQRLVGPLEKRYRDTSFLCYCNAPSSLETIFYDIQNNEVYEDALTCDDCWQIDITPTWGYYGWSKKIISQKNWDSLCEKRAELKFATYKTNGDRAIKLHKKRT